MTTHYVFLHGGGQGSWVWQQTIAALHRQADNGLDRILSLDAPGCGSKRDRTTDGLTIADVARELIDDIDSAGMQDVVLVGHSQAGQAMCLMARQRPDLFRRLIYVTCSIPLPGQTVQQMIGSSLHGTNEHEVGWPLDPKTTDMAARYREMFCNDMSRDEATAFLARLGKDMWPLQTYAHSDWPCDHLGDLPATFVICLQDKSLPVAWQEIFAERFKVERIVRLDAGHQGMNTRPFALAEILRHEARVTP